MKCASVQGNVQITSHLSPHTYACRNTHTQTTGLGCFSLQLRAHLNRDRKPCRAAKKNTLNSRRILDVNTYKHSLSLFDCVLLSLPLSPSLSLYALWWMLLSPALCCTMNMRCDPPLIPVGEFCLVSALPPPHEGSEVRGRAQLQSSHNLELVHIQCPA